MNTIYKTKSDFRTETEKQVELFLKKGGSIEIVKPRKTPKQKMTSKSSRGFVSGTGGFATGYPKQTFA